MKKITNATGLIYEEIEDREILIQALSEDGHVSTEEEITRLDRDLTILAGILFEYFAEQKQYGRKITDSYPQELK